MLQPSEVDIQIEVAVLKNRLDHIDESIHGIRDQIEEVEQRVMRLERTTYMLLGGLILLQVWPSIQDMLTNLPS
jgi:tetrahydromethanopterin S-methyltransferase subunit G